MGCISSSASTPAPIQSSKKIGKKKQNYHKSQIKIISSVLLENQNQGEEHKQTQRNRKKINKVEFTHEQESTQLAEKIVLSDEPLTLEDKQILEAVVAKNSIFHKLSTPERKELINKFVLYDSAFEGNEIKENDLIESDPYLFKKNDIGTIFFVVKKGKVQVELETTEGNYTTVTYGKEDSFGQLALLYRTRRTASVKCLGKCTFFCLSNKIFRETLQGLGQRTIDSNKILIERIKLFQYLSPKQKTKLASHIVLLKYEKGDIVFREGQDSLAFFVVVSGRVDIEVKGKPLLQLKSGQYFGESCFQENAKRSGTVQCSEKTQLMSISRAAVQKVFENQVVQQFYYMSILKWAIKRNPIFKQVPARSTEKLLKQSDIIHFVQGHELLKQGQKVKKLYIPIEGQINEFEIGDIVNVQYLVDIQKDKKTSIINQIPLVKKKDGYVCVIDINKVFSMLQKHAISISSINSKLIEDMKKIISSKKQIQEVHIRTMKYIRENNSLIKMQNFEMIKKIGQGQFGSIYKVRHTLDNSLYALKTFNKSNVESYKTRHFVKQEVDSMKRIDKHPFIAEFHKCFQTSEYFMILMEMIDGKDLFDTVMDIGWLPSEMVQFFFASFVLALEALHQHDIIYRDIKPENAVIDSKGYLKIIDLGTARKLDSSSGYRSFTIIGTPHYMAPEVIGGKGYSFSADIWSMGVLLYEMACGKFPFGQNLDQPIQIYNEIIKPNIHICFPKELKDAALKGLISRLLVKDPSIRSIDSFSEIKDSEFYHNFDWQKFEAKTLKAPYKPDVKHNLFDEVGNPDKKFGEENLATFIQRMESRAKKQPQQNPFVYWDEFDDNM